MTSRNLPTLTAIAGDPAVIVGLSLDALDVILGECADQVTIAGAAKKAINAYIEKSYAGDIAHAYAAQDKDFGTVRVSDGSYEIVVDTPKRTEWDQSELSAASARITAAGDDPSEYLDVTLSVPERKYTAWPAHIRDVFEPARTVKPGARSIKLVRKEAA